MMKGFRKLVEVGADVRQGEQVLVVADNPMVPISEVISAVAKASGAEHILCAMIPGGLMGLNPLRQ